MPILTPNIGLEAWDLGGDDFDHSQLANNWVAIDNHDHTPGRGLRITSPAIEPLNVLTEHIQLLNITQPLLATPSVGTAQLFPHSVTREILADPAVYTENIANQQVTYEKLDPTVLPLGSVILWYRKAGMTNLPGGGWEICDGRAWSSITNSLGYTTGNIPDMRDAFAIGADINGIVAPGIGQGGGANERNFAHSHGVNPHQHSVPPHLHGIAADGNHTHGFLGEDNNYHQLVQQLVRAPISEAEVRDALFNPGIHLDRTHESVIQEPSPLQFTGLHSHGGATGASAEFATSANGSSTDTQLGPVDMRPKFVSLLYIMRVR
jgi:hypothetical protein